MGGEDAVPRREDTTIPTCITVCGDVWQVKYRGAQPHCMLPVWGPAAQGISVPGPQERGTCGGLGGIGGHV